MDCVIQAVGHAATLDELRAHAESLRVTKKETHEGTSEEVESGFGHFSTLAHAMARATALVNSVTIPETQIEDLERQMSTIFETVMNCEARRNVFENELQQAKKYHEYFDLAKRLNEAVVWSEVVHGPAQTDAIPYLRMIASVFNQAQYLNFKEAREKPGLQEVIGYIEQKGGVLFNHFFSLLTRLNSELMSGLPLSINRASPLAKARHYEMAQLRQRVADVSSSFEKYLTRTFGPDEPDTPIGQLIRYGLTLSSTSLFDSRKLDELIDFQLEHVTDLAWSARFSVLSKVTFLDKALLLAEEVARYITLIAYNQYHLCVSLETLCNELSPASPATKPSRRASTASPTSPGKASTHIIYNWEDFLRSYGTPKAELSRLQRLHYIGTVLEQTQVQLPKLTESSSDTSFSFANYVLSQLTADTQYSGTLAEQLAPILRQYVCTLRYFIDGLPLLVRNVPGLSVGIVAWIVNMLLAQLSQFVTTRSGSPLLFSQFTINVLGHAWALVELLEGMRSDFAQVAGQAREYVKSMELALLHSLQYSASTVARALGVCILCKPALGTNSLKPLDEAVRSEQAMTAYEYACLRLVHRRLLRQDQLSDTGSESSLLGHHLEGLLAIIEYIVYYQKKTKNFDLATRASTVATLVSAFMDGMAFALSLYQLKQGLRTITGKAPPQSGTADFLTYDPMLLEKCITTSDIETIIQSCDTIIGHVLPILGKRLITQNPSSDGDAPLSLYAEVRYSLETTSHLYSVTSLQELITDTELTALTRIPVSQLRQGFVTTKATSGLGVAVNTYLEGLSDEIARYFSQVARAGMILLDDAHAELVLICCQPVYSHIDALFHAIRNSTLVVYSGKEFVDATPALLKLIEEECCRGLSSPTSIEFTAATNQFFHVSILHDILVELAKIKSKIPKNGVLMSYQQVWRYVLSTVATYMYQCTSALAPILPRLPKFCLLGCGRFLVLALEASNPALQCQLDNEQDRILTLVRDVLKAKFSKVLSS
ncbi:hypothetical protein GMRT_13989 [Giardia muris]|uniref:Uncharacterized protein n=1 Tax=Giardia muris TaxID=5742 RepID=A0A4Z1TAR2_GIAMU|nr:hypothetical protein GMRT_13989 [Giardia muris]|eukprot:TNJ29601.1 hypothetical protein GMRT_13989 [Giardia muris]